ncbi:MAG: TetR/AcrR family transcriptional regulator [Rhodoblastus sp.]
MDMETLETVDGRTRRRVENGARIFDAAVELLAERSYDEISIEDICAVANVGRATFFRIFQSKADLLLEFNRRLAERVQRRLDARKPRTAARALRIMGEEIADAWLATSPGASAIAMDFTQVAAGRGLHAAHPELLHVAVGIVERGLARGELRSALPAGLIGSLALVQITAPVSYWFRHPGRDLRQLIEEAVDHWLHGAAAKRGKKK